MTKVPARSLFAGDLAKPPSIEQNDGIVTIRVTKLPEPARLAPPQSNPLVSGIARLFRVGSPTIVFFSSIGAERSQVDATGVETEICPNEEAPTAGVSIEIPPLWRMRKKFFVRSRLQLK